MIKAAFYNFQQEQSKLQLTSIGISLLSIKYVYNICANTYIAEHLGLKLHMFPPKLKYEVIEHFLSFELSQFSFFLFLNRSEPVNTSHMFVVCPVTLCITSLTHCTE